MGCCLLNWKGGLIKKIGDRSFLVHSIICAKLSINVFWIPILLYEMASLLDICMLLISVEILMLVFVCFYAFLERWHKFIL